MLFYICIFFYLRCDLLINAGILLESLTVMLYSYMYFIALKFFVITPLPLFESLHIKHLIPNFSNKIIHKVA